MYIFLASSSTASCASPVWLDATAFASLLSLSTIHAQQILAESANGQPWRDHALHVRARPTPNVQSAPLYEVRADSLPAELYRQWFESAPMPVPPWWPVSHQLSLPVAPHPQDRQASKHRDLALWKRRLIQPALAYPKHSSARGEHLRQLSRSAHVRPDGRRRRVSLDSLYTWVAHYERAGFTALLRRPPNGGHHPPVGQCLPLAGRDATADRRAIGRTGTLVRGGRRTGLSDGGGAGGALRCTIFPGKPDGMR